MSDNELDRQDDVKDERITCESIDDYLPLPAEDAVASEIRAAFEEHLSTCPACRQRVESTLCLEGRLRQEARLERAPDGLWDGIVDSIEAEEVSLPLGRGPVRWRWPALAAVAAAAMLLIAVTSGGPATWMVQTDQPAVVTESTNDFITYRLSGRAPDIQGSDFESIARWLAPKVEFAPPGDLMVPAGFRLSGGRLCSFLNQRLVSYMFESRESAAALYVMAENRSAALGSEWGAMGEAVQQYRAGDLSTFVWRQDGLIYALVSDLSEGELHRFLRSMKGGTGAGHDGASGKAASLQPAGPIEQEATAVRLLSPG